MSQNYIYRHVSLENISIELNQNWMSPLTWILHTDIDFDGYFNIKIAAKKDQWIPINYKINYIAWSTKVPIYGLYPNYNNEIYVDFFDLKWRKKFSETYMIQTWLYTGPKLDLDIVVDNHKAEYRWLYGFMNKPVLFDQNGDIRWYLTNKDYIMVFSRLKNGNFLIWSETENIRYHLKYFYEVTPLWEEIKKYVIPKFFHHEILELENWNLLTSSSSGDFSSLAENAYREDTIIEINRTTGEIVKEFDLKDILWELKPDVLEKYSVKRDWGNQELVEITNWDWLHINSLYLGQNWDVIVSLRNTDMIISVNMNNKSLNWVLSHQHDFDSLKPYMLNVTWDKDIFLFPLLQHSAVFDNNGDMYVFDNGVWRSNLFKQKKEEKNQYSRVLKYSLDIKNKTASLEFDYVTPEFTYTPARWNVIPLKESILIWYTYNAVSSPRLLEISENWEILLDITEKSGDKYYRVAYHDIVENIN